MSLLPSPLHKSALPLATGLAILTIITALASQYWGGLIPCDLCLKQRWPYYLAIPLLLVAPFFSEASARRILSVAIIIFMGSFVLAGYHVGVEQKLWPGPTSCGGGLAMPDNIASLESLLSRGAVSCDTPAFSLFGISMAGFNALISFVIVALLVYALKTNKVCKEKDGQATP